MDCVMIATGVGCVLFTLQLLAVDEGLTSHSVTCHTHVATVNTSSVQALNQLIHVESSAHGGMVTMDVTMVLQFFVSLHTFVFEACRTLTHTFRQQ